MQDTLREIGRRFGLNADGTFLSFEELKNGNINKTYKVTYRTSDDSSRDYIFQRVNTYVFKNPCEIMENIEKVTEHIGKKNGGRPCISFLHTDDGKNYLWDSEFGFWRVMNYIDSVTVDSCASAESIRAVGEAFGEFQLSLSDFDGSVLHETIPSFHDTRKRLEALFAAAENDIAGRTASVCTELSHIREYAPEACILSDRYRAGEFPVRVTHNDTKANNVLFDRRTMRPIAVIDLDTVMPGMVMYDFGDAVRFIASTAAEDERDLQKVTFDESKFAAFADGFIKTTRDGLTDDELSCMVRGTFSITVELAARFLCDYLSGDLYFKIDYPDHNLVRAKNQLRLADDIFVKSARLSQIVKEQWRNDTDRCNGF